MVALGSPLLSMVTKMTKQSVLFDMEGKITRNILVHRNRTEHLAQQHRKTSYVTVKNHVLLKIWI